MRLPSQMTLEEIENVLREVDWTEVHKARVFGDYGASIVLYTDATFSIQDQGTYYRDSNAAGVLGYLNCWGIGNVDTTDYLEGWTKPETDEYGIDTGRFIVDWGFDTPDNGRILTLQEAIGEAIESGEWDHDEDIQAVLMNIEQDRDYRALLRGES